MRVESKEIICDSFFIIVDYVFCLIIGFDEEIERK